eukprot:7883664-Pyramimonas_sp.AAC.1
MGLRTFLRDVRRVPLLPCTFATSATKRQCGKAARRLFDMVLMDAMGWPGYDLRRSARWLNC